MRWKTALPSSATTLPVFLFESAGEVTERFLASLQVHLVTVGKGTYLWQAQGLIQEATESLPRVVSRRSGIDSR